MPMEPLFTDWSLYDQILFQVVSNSVKFNKIDGAISVSIYFQKEIKNAVKTNQAHLIGESTSPRSFEVGRIVTVVKDTGIGINSTQQKELFKIKTVIQSKKEGTDKGHLLQPKIQGVGLATAEVLTKCLGGSISVISKEECGTQVTFDVQVTTYPVKKKVPSYTYSDKGQTLTLPLKSQTLISEAYGNQFQKYRKVSDFQKGSESPQKVESIARDSICDSESIQNEEELKIFEKIFKHFDDIENKSEGHLYHPKPPENSFFNQDFYLDESILQYQNLNDKSSHSQKSYLFFPEEGKIASQMQQQLVYDVISNKSSQYRIEDQQMQLDHSHSQDVVMKTQSLQLGTITTNRILSFADVIRSSISKRSPLTAMIVSNPSMDYQKTPPTRTKSSEFKKIKTKTFNHRSEKTLPQYERRAKASDQALSFDDIKMKHGSKNPSEIRIKSQNLKNHSADIIIVDQQLKSQIKIKETGEIPKEEEKNASGSVQDSSKQVSSQPEKQKSLRFPIIFSSGVASSNENQHQSDIEDNRGKHFSYMPPQRQSDAQQDFTFQKGKSFNNASSSQEMMGRSSSVAIYSQPEEDSNQINRSDSIEQQVLMSAEQDEQRIKSLLQKIPRGGSSRSMVKKQPLVQIDEAEQLEKVSSNNFTDPSIGESEHCFATHEASGVVLMKEAEKLSKLDPPLQDRKRALSGIFLNKGFIGQGKSFQNSDIEQQADQEQQVNQKVEMILPTHSNSLKSSDDKQILQKAHQSQAFQSESLDLNYSLRKAQRRDLAKNVDEKMKANFSALPSVKRLTDSKQQLKKGLSASSNSRMCKCKQVLVITDELETAELIKDTVTQIDANGVDTAQDCANAIQTLSLKLTAMCCTDSYELIFVTLERDFLQQKITQRILETIDLWNEKLQSKGKKPIEKPQIVGITSQNLKKNQKEGIDTILQQPITAKQIRDIFVRVGSYLI